KRYCLEKSATTLPTMTLQVLDRRAAGSRAVFDLAVNDLHAFVAGTVCVHNCIGNSGPLPAPVSQAIEEHDLVVAAVLSGNRNFVRKPPYFDDMAARPAPVADLHGARVLAVLGDSITTDHISPAGSIKPTSPAGKYLIAQGVAPQDFNSYGSRRGNHEVMMRGTFANVRLRNKLAPGTEGGVTHHLPDGEPMSIYDAAMKYKAEGVPLVILAGKEYGSG